MKERKVTWLENLFFLEGSYPINIYKWRKFQLFKGEKKSLKSSILHPIFKDLHKYRHEKMSLSIHQGKKQCKIFQSVAVK